MRPALPPTQLPELPDDRDSTRVIAFPESGRFGVIFSRLPDGTRPTQKLVHSMAIAQTIAGEHKARKIITAFVVWLANFLPSQRGSKSKLPIADSGVRARPSEKRGAR